MDQDDVIGNRLATARKKKGLTQIELAEALGGRYNQQTISHVERDRSTLRVDGLVNAAKELNVSTDYVLGFTDDPTSADDRLSLAANTQFQSEELVPIFREWPLPVSREDTVASFEGVGLVFRRIQLQREGIDPDYARVFSVRGHSIYPTLPNASVILVDYQRTTLKDGCIYLFRTMGTLLVKRALQEETDRFWWTNDAPYFDAFQHDLRSDVWGQVRWVGGMLAESVEALPQVPLGASSAALSRQVLRRDGFTCQLCGARPGGLYDGPRKGSTRKYSR